MQTRAECRCESNQDTAIAIHPGLVQTRLAEQWMTGEEIFGKLAHPILKRIGPVLLPRLLISRKDAVNTILYAACAPRAEVCGSF